MVQRSKSKEVTLYSLESTPQTLGPLTDMNKTGASGYVFKCPKVGLQTPYFTTWMVMPL